MRGASLKGCLLAVLILSALVLLAPGSHGAWVNLFGLIVVLGGTLLAAMLSRPQPLVMDVIRSMPALFKGRREADFGVDVLQLLKLAQPFRHGQMRDVERHLKSIRQPLLRKGYRMLLDRCSEAELKRALQLEIARTSSIGREHVKVLRSMAGFAPAFGMLGTLLGLIHMLHGLGDQGLEYMGAAMGFALMTTLFGLLMANLLFKPLAIKLERQLDQQVSGLLMLSEGLLMVQGGKHPLLIKEHLEGYGLAETEADTSHRLASRPLVSAYAD